MTVEPVRMNCPFSPRPSTAIRTASHNTGASCHSSISLGFVLAVARYPVRLSGTCIRITLFACCKAVVVFPHHSPLRASYLYCSYSNTVCLTVILHILLFHLNLRTARGIQTEGGPPLLQHPQSASVSGTCSDEVLSLLPAELCNRMLFSSIPEIIDYRLMTVTVRAAGRKMKIRYRSATKKPAPRRSRSVAYWERFII